MNLVVLRGKKQAAALNGSADTLLYDIVGNYDFNKTDAAATAFANTLIKSLGVYTQGKNGATFNELWDYKSFGLRDVNDLGHALLLIRMILLQHGTDVIFKDMTGYKYIWQGGLSVEIKKDSGLDKALREFTSWDIFSNNNYTSFFRIALLAMDMAYRFYVGFKQESFPWDTNVQDKSFFNWYFNQNDDSINKEINTAMQRAAANYAKVKEDAANTAANIIATADKLENAYNAVAQTGDNLLFGNPLTAILLGASVMPAAMVIGIRPKNKAILAASIAASAIPLWIAGNYVAKSKAEISVKAKWGVPAAMGGASIGFLMGRFVISPTVHNVAKKGVKTAVNVQSRGLINL